MEKGPFNLPSITESIKAAVLLGKISLVEAAQELHAAGWMNYVDVEKAKRLLNL